ncbi:kinase-like protein [Xylaria scruposa]|nr:kinase-like protein [Xylaria scruposa]
MATQSKPSTRELRKQRFQRPQRGWKRLRAVLKAFEDGKYMKYNSVLGFGGFGIVTDWDILGADGNPYRSIAMKTAVDKEKQSTIDALKREIWWTKRFTGSEHLIQLADLDEGVMKAANINDENTAGLPNMAMEKMGRGSLYLLMKRLGYSSGFNNDIPNDMRLMEYIPNRTLWQIFLCLTRAVIGMAYPSQDPLSRKNMSIRESTEGIPPGYPATRLVHCDIDVQNIFVADPKDYPPDDEHRWAPIIKIADYGCMVEWSDGWDQKQKLKSLWGKRAYKAPEQFAPRCFVPFAMGPATNIYQIGQTMHDLITLKPIKFAQRMATYRTANGLYFATHGWRVLPDQDYNISDDWLNVDRGLRELVAGCMADSPLDRPSAELLELYIRGHIAHLDRQAAIEAAKPVLNPAASVFIPGQGFVSSQPPPPPPRPKDAYKKRMPHGQAEPDWLLQKFFNDYFVEDWSEPDWYEDCWAKKTLTPEESSNA